MLRFTLHYSKNGVSSFNIPLYCEDLENPCSDPACQPYYNCEVPIPTPNIQLENYFETYDLSILNGSDSIQIQNYLISKNQGLIDLLCTYFPHTYKRNELNPGDVSIIWAALIHMLAEGEGQFTSGTMAAMRIINWQCVRGVVQGVFDVTSLVEDYVSLIRSGGSWTSVRTLVWRTMKRYGGWMVAAGVIYDISTECI